MVKNQLMTNEQLQAFYVRVLEIAAWRRGMRRQAQKMLVWIKAEMLRRGM